MFYTLYICGSLIQNNLAAVVKSSDSLFGFKKIRLKILEILVADM